MTQLMRKQRLAAGEEEIYRTLLILQTLQIKNLSHIV